MEETQFVLSTPHGELDTTLLTPSNACALFVFSHGAGAGHRHASMAAIANALAAHEIATLRFNFPFMQAGRRRVDARDVATAVIQEAFVHAQQYDLPRFLCGHSFGGRMNSHAVVDHSIQCAGLVYCSFPLHPAKKPSVQRAAHLEQIKEPMLFLSGTRDDLADAPLLKGVVESLPSAQLHWLETANHSYTILKRTRVNPLDVFTEIAQRARRFVDELI